MAKIEGLVLKNLRNKSIPGLSNARVGICKVMDDYWTPELMEKMEKGELGIGASNIDRTLKLPDDYRSALDFVGHMPTAPQVMPIKGRPLRIRLVVK